LTDDDGIQIVGQVPASVSATITDAIVRQTKGGVTAVVASSRPSAALQ
jgi:hypothetical protein